jgi:hypothetical protein
MPSIFDILVNEVANVLGISPKEVLERFTKEELDELLKNSLCEPSSSIPTVFPNVSDLDCDDPLPQLPPKIELDLTDINNKIQEQKDKSPDKCLDSVKEVNELIKKQIKEYSDHRIILTKLIEYRDNIIPIKFYYEERAKESARILNLFSPLLKENERIDSLIIKYNSDISKLNIELIGAAFNVPLTEKINKQILEINHKINTEQKNKTANLNLIKNREKSIPIFKKSNIVIATILAGVVDPLTSEALFSDLLNTYLSPTEFFKVKTIISQYSNLISINSSFKPKTVQQALNTNYLSFSLAFPNLNYLLIEEEEKNELTGDRTIKKVNFKIKENVLIEKKSFFKENRLFNLSQYNNSVILPGGILYTKYYNLFEDPINNFFTLDERGLTNDEQLVDARVKGTEGEKKKEGAKEFFVKDLDTLQEFYKTFEKSLEVRTESVKNKEVIPVQDSIKYYMEKLARAEIQFLLSFSGVSTHLSKNSNTLKTFIDKIDSENNLFASSYSDLDKEIERIEILVDELKPTPDKIKKLLRESSSECFDKIDEPIDECPDVFEKLGIDPLFTQTSNGVDPTLPNPNQLCYWIQFSLVLNLMGLIPMPNLPNQLRYWPVGLTVTAPSGLVKIPLPIIWIPLVALSSPLGSIVIFLTINGIFISPIVFFVSNSGFKQHILTVKGSSEKFGYDSQDETIKEDIQSTVSELAMAESLNRQSNEEQFGKNYNLTDSEKIDLQNNKNILSMRNENAKDNNNKTQELRTDKAIKDLNKSTEGLGEFEKLQQITDRKESPTDIINELKISLISQLNSLGTPRLDNSNKIKEKIYNKQDNDLINLKEAISNCDTKKAKEIRESSKNDNIPLSEKIDAVCSDAHTHFNKLTFPKVKIPKNAQAIDPKQNAIFEFLDTIISFIELSKSKFFPDDFKSAKKVFLIEFAKSENKIKTQLASTFGDTGGILDLSKDQDKVKEALKSITTTLTDKIKGKNDSGEMGKAEENILDFKNQSDSEPDKVKKTKLDLKVKNLQTSLNELNESKNNFDRNKLASPEMLLSFALLGIDFNPFSPCCAKSPFSLPQFLPLPIEIPLAIVKSILDGIIDGFSDDDLSSFFGKSESVIPDSGDAAVPDEIPSNKISISEIGTTYINMIKQYIPDIEFPIPEFDVASFTSVFASILIPLFEPKAPILAAQPAMFASIPIDLNILKGPASALFKTFCISSLPDPIDIPSASTEEIPTDPENTPKIDPKINIVDCHQDTSNNSILSDGTYSGKKKPLPDSDTYKPSSNIFLTSEKDVLPNFRSLDTSFVNVNPEDISSMLITFVDLFLSTLEDILKPFYSILDIVQPTRDANLNIVEFVQQKIPPAGPPNELKFTAVTKLKQAAPASANFKIPDLGKIEIKTKLFETALAPIINSPLPMILAVAGGVASSLLPEIKVPSIDSSGTVSVKDMKLPTFALRQLHPILNQDDIPPWERISPKNILFLIFLDQFISTAADQVGLFRDYL